MRPRVLLLSEKKLDSIREAPDNGVRPLRIDNFFILPESLATVLHLLWHLHRV
jgi:hypothetical protein